MKQKAVEDANRTQSSIVRECADTGKTPPPYVLTELIGKGSFGRVYKATASEPASDPTTRQLFAVKIISIEQGDIQQPGAADTFGDVLKEVNTLKLLRNSDAENINHIVDALLVSQSVWIVTEHCAGGSVSSLMRPTGGLPERWIVPILREVAEALSWVHQEGIIHRDVKCANVLVTKMGDVQLCDFGVAGILETSFDKRRTVTGTLPWMAPELFDNTVSYGIEVDVWAFGAMAYEIASGLPPNATKTVDISKFGSYLKAHCPRLEGDQYPERLKDLVAFCMVEEPLQRPPAQQVQQHPFLHNTSRDFPTASLTSLVEAYRVWEAQGGNRRSLFNPGGAQEVGVTEPDPFQDNGWDFGTTYEPDSEESFAYDAEIEKVHDVYGPGLDFLTPRAAAKPPRRRRMPRQMKEFKVPLQKVFDPNTMSKYDENARAFYGRAAPASDLPLRDDTGQLAVRKSLIDLDIATRTTYTEDELAAPAGMETIRYRPKSSDGASFDRRRTQDWTFPAMAPASAGPGGPSPPSLLTEDAIGQPHRASALSLIDLNARLERDSQFPTDGTMPPSANRISAASLIDLDASFAAVSPRSNVASDTASLESERTNASFSLDTHSAIQPVSNPTGEPVSETDSSREPSLYAPDGLGELATVAGLKGPSSPTPNHGSQLDGGHDGYLQETTQSWRLSLPAPPPPFDNVMQGLASPDEVKDELERMILRLGEHLQACNSFLKDLPQDRTS